MRFLELDLRAFGCFTARPPIELPDVGGPGLCVVYGTNEAGKSTALRAIRALLYGIPPRSPDDFIHRYADLRVAARLRFDDGEELGVTRRKRAKDSLYSYDDSQVMSSSRIDALVERVPETLFERFYGLDHRSLTDGSAALLQDDGEVGRALFGAGLGVANLRSVLERLESEAAALFAPRASRPRINAALSEWNELRKEIGAGSLDPREWAAQEERVRGAEAELATLDRELDEARQELSRSLRLKRSLPALARRSVAARALQALEADSPVAALPDDFAERLTAARAARRSAEEGRRRAESRIERETRACEALALAPGVLAEQERIEALHQRVGGYEEAVDQLPRRESRLAALDQELAALDQEIEAAIPGPAAGSGSPGRLRPAWLTTMRQAVARAASTRALASEGLKLEDRLAKLRDEASELRAELEELRASPDALAGPVPDPGPLRLALGRAQQLGPLDDRLAEAQQAAQAFELEIGRLAEGLGFAAGRVDSLASAALPSHEWIDSMRERFAEQARRRDRLDEEIDTLRSEARQVDEERARHAGQGALPRLEDLEAGREARDRAWRELRRAAIEAAEPPERIERVGLADRFEQALRSSDGLGDRLRIDAERVAEQASLEARRSRLARELEDLEARGRGLEEIRVALDLEWQQAWKRTAIVAGTPEAMRGWRRGVDELFGRIAQRRELSQSLARDTRLRDEAIAALAAARAAADVEDTPDGVRMPGETQAGGPARAGAGLRDWTTIAQLALEALVAREEIRRRHVEATEQAEERLARSLQREAEATAALERWRHEWDDAVGFLEAGDRVRPERALEQLEAIARLLERLRERDELAERVSLMRRDVSVFEQDVSRLVAARAPELAELPAALATRRLNRMLGEALKQQTLREKSQEALAEAREELESAVAQGREAERSIVALCALGAVEDESLLDEALRRWREAEQGAAALRAAEDELINLAEGRPVAELEAESRGVDSDALAARIESLEERVRQRTDAQKRAIAELRSQRDLLESMNGSARVAELAEAAESKLAGIRRDVDRYIELRMARQILEEEIERYRSENQAPLLARSGEIFGALTRGAYPRITSEVGVDGKGLRLMAASRAGAETPVSGLSAGTRDQLFLAIRLASLEEAQSRGESMPLVADDILIEFDDDRSRATLEVLAELARENQILLFSHHLHIAEIARDLKDQAYLVEL